MPKGHLLSFSTVPMAGDAKYPEMMSELSRIFAQYNQQGLVDVEYETKTYLVHLGRR